MALDIATPPVEGISLFGASDGGGSKAGRSSALLVKLDAGTVRELKRASKERDGLRFSTGATPKLRIGSKSIDLTISADAFRTELFASTAGNTEDLYFTSTVSHRIELQNVEKKANGSTGGSDAALAQLQNSLASYEQEKQANKTNITTSVLPAPKNRFEAARKEKLGKRGNLGGTPGGSGPGSPSLGAVGTTRLGAGPTSMPASEDELKMQAMKTSLLHLLAMKPMKIEDAAVKTHIPRPDVQDLLQRYGKQTEGKWQLTDRAYRDLDVWRFKYPSKSDRQTAIDNAVKAYDRMRLGKEDKLWQTLLPKEERGKGKVMSRLHLGSGQLNNRGLTPLHQPSPMPHAEGSDSRIASGANTPRVGGSTPRPNSSKGDVMKRLLSKDPKKARAVEEAKDRKRKEREVAAHDRDSDKRPVKKQAMQKTNVNVKSAEFVHSSDEETSDEVAIKSQPKTTEQNSKPKPKSLPAVRSSSSTESSDEALKTKMKKKPAAHARATSTASKQDASPALKPSKSVPAGKATPQANSSLSAPASQHKTQRSPQKQDSRPNIPSPLGAARPRVASDVSDRGAVGVQRVRHGGGETPKGLGISNGVNKAKEETAGSATTGSSKAKKDQNPQKTQANGVNTPKTTSASGANHKSPEDNLKRKADTDKTVLPPPKHRKTTSTSSQSHASGNNGNSSTSPSSDPLSSTSVTSNESGASVMEGITYTQGVVMAEKFREVYYPAYVKLYDEQQEMEARGEKVSETERERLLQMHKRLEQMKKEMVVAGQRG